MPIVGCSILLAQQIAVLIAVMISIFNLHMTGPGFIVEIMVAVESFCFLGLVVGLAAMILWCEIKNRALFPN